MLIWSEKGHNFGLFLLKFPQKFCASSVQRIFFKGFLAIFRGGIFSAPPLTLAKKSPLGGSLLIWKIQVFRKSAPPPSPKILWETLLAFTFLWKKIGLFFLWTSTPMFEVALGIGGTLHFNFGVHPLENPKYTPENKNMVNKARAKKLKLQL